VIHGRFVLSAGAATAAIVVALGASGQDVPAAAAPAATPAPAPGSIVAKPPVFVMPAEKSTEVATHWSLRRDYLRDRDERRADDEVQRVRQLKDDLALTNLFFIGGALIRESHDALAAGSPSQASARCKLAVELAPAMEEAHLCLVRAILSEDPTAVKPAAAELYAAATTALDDPRLSRAAFANLLSVLFLGLLAAGTVFVVVIFARYANLYAHDVHHLFPVGARRWQTKMLAAVLLLLPVFLQMGPLPLVFTALLAVALYLSTVEMVVATLLLAALAATPWAAEGIGRIAAFGGPAVDVWLLEHGEGSGPEVARLQKRLDSGANDFAVDFALAHKAKRDGDLAIAEKLYLRAIEAGSNNTGLAAVHNNLGNVLLLEGDVAKGQAHYQQSIDLREGVAASHFNLSRALGLNGVEALEKVQSEQGRANELDRLGIKDFTGDQLQANRKANKFVLDVPLDDSLLQPLLDNEIRTAGPVGDEVRAQLSFGLPAEAASGLPVIVALLIFALHLLRGRLRPSGRCERCGREVCKRCDPDARPSEQLCAQCVNVFIRRTGVDAAERIRKEYAVQAYHRQGHAMARVLGVLSGAGHVMMGYPVRGIVYLTATGSLGASIVLWHGLAHGPVAVRSSLSLFRIGLTAAGFIAIYAICLRDLVNRQRAKEGS
jgi:tetratricopeptide (TPR) repeat protein